MLIQPEKLDITKLRSDFAGYYAPQLLRIRHKDTGDLIPFVLNSAQRKADAILEHYSKRHRVLLYVLKARQEGISTWAEGRIFHKAHLFKNVQASILAHTTSSSEKIFGLSRRYYDCLPSKWQPMLKYNSKRQLLFENPKHTGGEAGLKSWIDVSTAGRGDSRRGETFSYVHLSEFAFYEDGEKLLTTILPAVTKAPGHFAIMETTANGINNYAHDRWLEFNKNFERYGDDSDLIPLFLAWFDLDEYQRGFIDQDTQDKFIKSLDKEEKSLQEHYKLNPYQLHWRRRKIEELGDLDMFLQEYPATSEEAFRLSGRPIFDRAKIRLALQSVIEPRFRGEIASDGRISKNSSGRLSIWKAPDKAKKYIVSVDPKGDPISGGSDDPLANNMIRNMGDECVIEVLEKDSLEQVAEWVGYVEPMSMVPYIKAMGDFYGSEETGAEVVIERNTGSGLIYELSKTYYNLYRLERFDSLKNAVTMTYGWDTNVRTKPMLIDFATFCFHNGYCKVNSAKLLEEMGTFIHNTNSGEADFGSADNRVMAWMIGLFIAGKGKDNFFSHTLGRYEKEEIEREREKEKFRSQLRLAEIDTDHLDPDFYDRREAATSRMDWLSIW